MNVIEQAANTLKNSKYAMAFTGAGISVESGVPPFRGSENSVWNNYDPQCLDISYFHRYPAESWKAIKEIFYNFMNKDIKPNAAHYALAELEKQGIIKCVVTQNIDVLHQQAGSKNVYEFHGTTGHCSCPKGHVVDAEKVDLNNLPPRCPKCGEILKPDFIFFGEGIPQEAFNNSFDAAKRCDVCLVIGSTCEVTPAAMVPIEAKRLGATIIEINPMKSAITDRYTDIYIAQKAGDAMTEILSAMKS
ncbi:MAG: NAD-dependent deacylase [Marinilabiliaceae bacterium]|nr:NAD-dependent deacylase [Marinilabiliaceae bacterium]